MKTRTYILTLRGHVSLLQFHRAGFKARYHYFEDHTRVFVPAETKAEAEALLDSVLA